MEDKNEKIRIKVKHKTDAFSEIAQNLCLKLFLLVNIITAYIDFVAIIS